MEVDCFHFFYLHEMYNIETRLLHVEHVYYYVSIRFIIIISLSQNRYATIILHDIIYYYYIILLFFSIILLYMKIDCIELKCIKNTQNNHFNNKTKIIVINQQSK